MKHIALGLGLSDYYDHGVARGIIQYAKTQPGWRLYGQGWMFSPLEDLSNWRGDGVIARVVYPEIASTLRRLGCPVVDVANGYPLPGIVRVCNDDRETGRIAARHFVANGFKSFAYCGEQNALWSHLRYEGFLEQIGVREVPHFDRPLEWWLEEHHSEELSAFLMELPKPLALFACSDKAGLRTSRVCAEAALVVPDDVAILGVDNEDIPCELSDPPLSSIELQLERIGFEAARTLHLLFDRTMDKLDQVLIPPLGVAERRSTASYASTNPIVVDAYRAIRADNGHRKTVAGVAAELAVSRRSLENHFKRETGHTVHEVIVAQKVRVAMRLLRTTNLKIEAVAEEAGFGSAQRFFAHFKARVGTTPSQFRSRHDGLRAVDGLPR